MQLFVRPSSKRQMRHGEVKRETCHSCNHSCRLATTTTSSSSSSPSSCSSCSSSSLLFALLLLLWLLLPLLPLLLLLPPPPRLLLQQLLPLLGAACASFVVNGCCYRCTISVMCYRKRAPSLDTPAPTNNASPPPDVPVVGMDVKDAHHTMHGRGGR